MKLSNYHQTVITEHFYHPKRNACLLAVTSFSSPPSPWQPLIYFLSLWIYQFWRFHMDLYNMWPFVSWLLSFLCVSYFLFLMFIYLFIFLLVIHFIHISVYMSIPISQFRGDLILRITVLNASVSLDHVQVECPDLEISGHPLPLPCPSPPIPTPTAIVSPLGPGRPSLPLQES